MNRKESFTLVEVLVTMAILALFLSIATLNIKGVQGFIENQSLKVQCREIHQALIIARNNAIIDGRVRKVFIYEDKLYIKTIDENKELKAEKIIFKDSTRIISNTYYGKNLTFYPVGTVNLGGRIIFKNAQGIKKTIVVQIGTGRIYIEEENH